MVLNGKNLSKFDKDFIKNYDEDTNKGYILEVVVEYPKNLLNLPIDSPKKMRIKSLWAICMIKKNILFA